MHDTFLRYFDEVARQGSIRKAARVLNVASTTVNRRILSTEKQLGVRLFHRTPDGVRPSAAGRVVLEHCRRTLFDFERIQLMIDDIRDLRTGHVDILALDSIALGILPDAVLQLSHTYPEVSFSIATAQPHEILTTLAAGGADVGLSFWEPDHKDIRSLVEKSAPIGAIMLPNHPLAGRDMLGIDDLVGFPTVRSIDARGRNSVIDQVMSDVSDTLKTRFFTNSLPFAKRMILEGRGIGLYTKLGFLKEIADGHLSYVPLELGGLNQFKVAVIVSSKVSLSPIKHAVCNEIGRALREMRLDS